MNEKLEAFKEEMKRTKPSPLMDKIEARMKLTEMGSVIYTLRNQIEVKQIEMDHTFDKKKLKELLRQREEHQRAIEILQSVNLNTE